MLPTIPEPIVMRPILISLVLAALPASAQTGAAPASTPSQATPGQQSEMYVRRGAAAEKAGDPDAAREAYTQALRLNPRNATARYRLGQLKSTSAKIAAQGRENQIGSVMIPAIQLDSATLTESLELLAKMIERETDSKVAPNFVLQDPTGELGKSPITLQLKNVPARAVLKYLTTQSNSKLRFDEHAVVISPR